VQIKFIPSEYRNLLNFLLIKLQGYKSIILQITIISAIDSLLYIFLAKQFGLLIEELNNSVPYKDKLYTLTFLIIAKVSITYLRNWKMLFGSKMMSIEIKRDFIRLINESNFSNLSKYQEGDLIQKIFFELNGVQKFLFFGSQDALRNSFLLCCGVVYLFMIIPHSIFIIVIYLILILFINNRVWLRIVRSNKIINKINSIIAINFVDIFSGSDDIRMYRIKDYVMFKVHTSFEKLKTQAKINARLKAYNLMNVEFTLFLGVASLLILMFEQNINLSDKITLSLMFSVLIVPFKNINAYFSDFSKQFSSIVRLNQLYNNMISKSGDFRTIHYCEEQLLIKLTNLTFSYNKFSNLIFKNYNITFKKGIHLLKGKNGIGKSTLGKLICGLLPLNSGEIDIYCRKSTPLYVSQNPYLFTTSVKSNILLDTNFTDEKLNLLIKKLSLESFFENLPMHRILKDNGKTLSGGQKQIIALLRALIQEPDILILDEFTNSLSHSLITKLSESICDMRKEKITILISHKELELQYESINTLN